MHTICGERERKIGREKKRKIGREKKRKKREGDVEI